MDNIYSYTPWEVYNNLQKFINYSRIETKHKWLIQKDFMTTISSGYITIQGTHTNFHTGEKSPYDIVITLEDMRVHNTTEKFISLYRNVQRKEKFTLLLITPGILSNYVRKKVDEYNHTGHHIISYTYDMFSIVIPEHNMVPKHEIMTQDEISDLLTLTRTTLQSYPKIYITDPPVAWIGAEVGDLIRIHRHSETTGKSIAYRRVVNR